MIVAVASGGGSDDGPKLVEDDKSSSSDGGDEDKAGSKDKPYAIGQTVELAGTQYTVDNVETAPTVGGEFFSETADGIYVVVTLTIENKKDETKVFSDTAAKFIGANGKSYSTDTDGTIAATGDGEPLMFEQMQPDLPKTGLLVFDVPKDATAGGLLEVADLFGKGEAYVDLGLK